MRPLLSLIPWLTLVGCSSDPNALPRDAVLDRGLRSALYPEKPVGEGKLPPEIACQAVPIPPGASCEDLGQLVDAWIACTSRCEIDTDCTVAALPVGPCRNWCQLPAGVSATSTYLDALGAALESRGCQTAGCACVRPPSSASCHAGRCQSSR